MAREDDIRLIAYNIWEEEGCPPGRDCDHWYRAEVIWEERQKPKATARSTKTESKAAAKQSPKASTQKKSK